MNVNPTEREDGSVERPEDGKSPDPNASPKEERKDDGKGAGAIDDDDDEGEDDSPATFSP